MTTDVEIRLEAAGSIDDLLSLRNAFGSEEQFRGRITHRQDRRPGDSLGAVTDSIAVALGPGGAGALLATVLVTWIRQRRSAVSIRLRKRDGSEIELDAQRVKLADAKQLKELVEEISDQLGEIEK